MQQYREIIDAAGNSLISVKKANSLIKSIGKESLLANKLLLTALLKVKLSDGSNIPAERSKYFKALQKRTGVDFSIGLVAEMDNTMLRTVMNETSGSYYTAISDIMDPASSKFLARQWGIIFDDQKSGLLGFVNIINAAVYDNKTGKMFVKFSDEEAIRDQIYNIKNGYTMLNYRVMMNLKSVYSYKLYELLLSAIGLDDFKSGSHNDSYIAKFGISELKYRFGVLDALYSKEVRAAVAQAKNADDYEYIEKYISKEKRKAANFYEFEQRVVKKAVNELNALPDTESDYIISYSFEYGTNKRTPKAIIFTTKRRHCTALTDKTSSDNATDAITVEPRTISDMDKQLEILDEMRGFIREDLKSKELLEIAKVADYDMERVRNAYDVAERSSSKINNLVGFLKAAIQNGYAEPISKRSATKMIGWTDVHSESALDLDELVKRKIQGGAILGNFNADSE